MPALTHGRVKNGFNLFPRTITYAQRSCKDANGNSLPCCNNKLQQQPTPCGGQKSFCCGRPIQPNSLLNKGGLTTNSRVPTGPATRKRAISSGGVGSRSFSVRRAIGRRVQNRNQFPKGYGLNDRKPPTKKGLDIQTGIKNSFGAECEKNACACCLPTQPVPAPRNGFNFVIY